MASIEKAYLATIQRFRNYYESFEGHKVALRPITAVDSEIVEYITTDNWPNKTDEYENGYWVADLTNGIIQHPYKFANTGKLLWNTYEEVLNNSEVTEALREKKQNAKDFFTVDGVTVPTTHGRYKKTDLSKPSWKKEVIESSEFNGLITKAELDHDFIQAFKDTYGDYTQSDLGNVIRVEVEKAEVNVLRPWFDERIVESREWRLLDGRTVDNKTFLSDIATNKAYKGALPGYILKVILVRNIEVFFSKTDDDKGEDIENISNSGSLINFGPLILNGLNRRANTLSLRGLQTNLVIKRNLEIEHLETLKLSVPANIAAPAANIKLNMPVGPKPTNIATSGQSLNARPINLPNQNSVSFTPKPKIQLPTNLNQNIKLEHVKAVQAASTIPELAILNYMKAGRLYEISPRIGVTLKGRIKGKDGKTIEGASILITKLEENKKVKSKHTNSSKTGDYKIFLEQEKRYRIEITKAGYLPKIVTITTKKEKEIITNFVLTQKTRTTQVEKDTDIQVLGFLYKKLGKAPNPYPDFEPFIDDFPI